MNVRRLDIDEKIVSLDVGGLHAGAWIITGGTRTGVMEIVGEAAREYMLQNGLAEQKIVLLGVVAWSMVANKNCLVVGFSFYYCHI